MQGLHDTPVSLNGQCILQLFPTFQLKVCMSYVNVLIQSPKYQNFVQLLHEDPPIPLLPDVPDSCSKYMSIQDK